jgi:MGT family glycosyltransferase
MAHFLFCPAPEAGDVYPTVPVALQLRSRGHEVAYLTDAGFAPELRGEGFTSYVDEGGICGADARYRSDPASVAYAPLRAQVDALAKVLRAFPADVIVDGSFPFGPRLFSELHDIPLASLHAGCFPIPTSDPLFPYGAGQLPPRDNRARSLARLARLVQDDRQRGAIEEWDKSRLRLGLPPAGAHPARSAASPLLVLIASSPAFEYPRTDLPEQFWFTGPLVWQSRGSGVPERIARLSQNKPLVYVSQGATYNTNPVILKLAFEALASEQVQVVATTVRPFDSSEFDPLPENVMLERFVPFSQIVDRVSVVITHGGAGAVQAALSHGVPVITLPFTADQFEVAARCVWTGVGIRLDPWRTTAAQLRNAVREVLSKPDYRANAAKIMRSSSQLSGPRLAGSLLERLAESRQPVKRPAAARNPWVGGVAA